MVYFIRDSNTFHAAQSLNPVFVILCDQSAEHISIPPLFVFSFSLTGGIHINRWLKLIQLHFNNNELVNFVDSNPLDEM